MYPLSHFNKKKRRQLVRLVPPLPPRKLSGKMYPGPEKGTAKKEIPVMDDNGTELL